jgi:hypothetical protein
MHFLCPGLSLMRKKSDFLNSFFQTNIFFAQIISLCSSKVAIVKKTSCRFILYRINKRSKNNLPEVIPCSDIYFLEYTRDIHDISLMI